MLRTIKYFLQNANLKFTWSLCLFSFLTMWIVFFLRFYIFLTNNRENQQTKNKVQVFQKKQYNLKLYRPIPKTEANVNADDACKICIRIYMNKYYLQTVWFQLQSTEFVLFSFIIRLFWYMKRYFQASNSHLCFISVFSVVSNSKYAIKKLLTTFKP